jgi:hypothetical protein
MSMQRCSWTSPKKRARVETAKNGSQRTRTQQVRALSSMI